MQIVFLIGRLTEDAVLRTASRQGVKYEFITYALAVNEERGNERITTYYDVNGPKTGDLAFLKKGAKVALVGNYLCTESVNATTGRTYHRHNVSTLKLEVIATGKPASDATQGDLPEK